MARQGNTDTDMGLENIFKEMEKLKSMCVKVGIPEDAETGDGLHIAQYAAWNELGVRNKDDSGWYIPPRPFMRNTADGKRGKIQEAIDKYIGSVLQGKADTKTALSGMGEAVVGLTKDTIKEGPWEKNSPITIHGTNPKIPGKRRKSTYQFIKGKGSSKPLIDTGIMKNSIQYIIEQNGKEIARGRGK
jgi:hypothetical protein